MYGQYNLTPAQKILFDYGIAKIGSPQSITPQLYEGVIAGSEYLTYDAKKLYIMLEGMFSVLSMQNVGNNTIITYNEANAAMNILENNAVLYNTAIYYESNYVTMTNHYFSRIVANNYTNMKFLGFKIIFP